MLVCYMRNQRNTYRTANRFLEVCRDFEKFRAKKYKIHFGNCIENIEQALLAEGEIYISA